MTTNSAHNPADTGLRVLVVEDEPFLNKVVCQFLAFKQAAPVAAENFAQAVQCLHNESFDLILLDQHLPDGDGLALVDHLNHAKLSTPVIMMSGDDDQALMVRAFEAGVDDFLIKPVNFELAWLKIQRLLKQRALKQRVDEQRRALEKLLYDKYLEEKMALHLYQHVLESGQQTIPCVESIIIPNAQFSGDLVLSRCSPTGNLYVLVADATGHGLAAALSAMPLATVFKTLVDADSGLAKLVLALNQTTLLHTPDDRFVACVLVEFDILNQQILVWNGGMPEVLLVDPAGTIVATFRSAQMALGILEDELFDTNPERYPMPTAGLLVVASDGVIEQENQQGEAFGRERWYQFVSAQPLPSLGTFASDLLAFSGKRRVDDDVTLCRIDIAGLRSIS